jgi:hypothetical protein
MASIENERRYFDALKCIASYSPPDRLFRTAEKEYGLSYYEALEMAYENVIEEAKSALRGRRRPKGAHPPNSAQP